MNLSRMVLLLAGVTWVGCGPAPRFGSAPAAERIAAPRFRVVGFHAILPATCEAPLPMIELFVGSNSLYTKAVESSVTAKDADLDLNSLRVNLHVFDGDLVVPIESSAIAGDDHSGRYCGAISWMSSQVGQVSLGRVSCAAGHPELGEVREYLSTLCREEP